MGLHPCKCQTAVDNMYKSCLGCTGASYSVGDATNGKYTDTKNIVYEDKYDGTPKTLSKTTNKYTQQLWNNGVATAALTDHIEDKGVKVGPVDYVKKGQSIGGECKLYENPNDPCPMENEVGTKDVEQTIAKCPASALTAATPSKVLAAGAYTTMPTLVTAVLAIVSAVF